ncbi:pantoate--beta-alanine ligase [Lunatibacter salilacus]|uniref:pantoate--beta-alanine ligase n=1 Tax=Lunatibacter salilacus TaxID=2483804 RepID=UPI00131E6481|nr:pantoate--beta-alanine ligase [Lunatibacter salilacus]
MDIIKLIPSLKSFLKPFYLADKKIGLVPTMGALHEGHLALVRRSKAENDLTVVTIFVNPAQFNNPDDLDKYPRSLDADLALLRDEGVDLVFVPEVEEIYPQPIGISINFSLLENTLEGKFRPNHFGGVAIIVAKLFHLIAPDVAYFGQKDLQQVSIISRLVSDLHFDLEIAMIASVREKNGLALSSRNQRLNEREREQATVLYQSLQFSKTELLLGTSWLDIVERAASLIAEKPLVRLEYLELVNVHDFTLAKEINSQIPQAICIAAYVGDIRLIDNILLSD